MSDHYLPTGAIVVNYQGQLSKFGHKFGQHQLIDTCPCHPVVKGMVFTHNPLPN